MDAHQAAGPVSHAIRVNGAAKPTATGDSTNTLSAHTVRAHAYMRATSTPAALCLARSAPHLYIYPSHRYAHLTHPLDHESIS